MTSKIEYKGYVADVGIEDDTLYGTVHGIQDSISFEAPTVEALRREFADAMDEYFEHCEKVGREPSKPFSGKFQLRMDPALHRRVALAAAESNKRSLNAWVIEAIKKQLEQ